MQGHTMLKIGDRLPACYFQESVPGEDGACALGPVTVDIAQACRGKRIAIVAVPAAFSPTCSARHLPGYLEHAQQFHDAGVDEIWFTSVNDAFVMAAWGREQRTHGVVRMMADGSAQFAQATGLALDLGARGMGMRSQRYAMLVKDGVVQSLYVEEPGKFEISDAATLLAAARRIV